MLESLRRQVKRRTWGSVALLLRVILVLAATYLSLVGQNAARGRHIQQLQSEYFRLRRENAQLEVKIAQASSIETLQRRAVEELGMEVVPPERMEFFVPLE